MPFLLFIKIEIVTTCCNSKFWCRSKNWNECNKGNNGTNFNYCLFDSKLIGTKKIFNFIFRRLNLIVKILHMTGDVFKPNPVFGQFEAIFWEVVNLCKSENSLISFHECFARVQNFKRSGPIKLLLSFTSSSRKCYYYTGNWKIRVCMNS